MKKFRKWVCLVLVFIVLCTFAVPVSASGGMSAAMILPQVSRSVSAVNDNGSEAVQCADFDEAVGVLREKMVARQTTIALSFPHAENNEQIAMDALYAAWEHTGIPDQGDYLRWHVKRCATSFNVVELEGQYQLTVGYTFTYNSDLQQEMQVTAAVKTLLDQLDVYEAADYEKVCAIYDYVCANVDFDDWGLMIGDRLIYTAYGALIQKAAVCQGFATLVYRLALELGVDCRLIAGVSKSQNHGWNIVRIGEYYYHLDATWDSDKGKPYRYFLLCEDSLTDHTRKAEYMTEEFFRDYPMAPVNYARYQKLYSGDLDDNGQVNEDDAIYLLQHVLMPDFFPVALIRDYTGDAQVDEDDAIYLLQHVLMPEQFPI